MFGAAPAPVTSPPRAAKPLRRALWLACALVGLWLVMQFVPRTPAAPPAAVASAPAAARAADEDLDTGTVAGRGLTLREERSLFSPGYLVALALLVGGGYFALQLRKRKAGAAELAPDALRSLGTLTLAQGQTLHLVACGTEVLLVGQSGTGVTLLATYPRAAFEARAGVQPLQRADDTMPAASPEAPPSFAEILRARAPHLFVTGEGRAA